MSQIIGFDQRSDITFVSGLDLRRAYGVGRQAVERLHADQTDFLSCLSRSPDPARDAEFAAVPFSEIGDYSRTLHPRWIWHGNFDVTDEYVAYVEPLIGDVPVDIPGLASRHNFAFQKGPNVQKKLQPWNAELVCAIDSSQPRELTAILNPVDNTVR